jgi:protocadherin delta 1
MGTLDFETARAHTLAVMAHDLGQSPFSAFTRVVVHVEDVNDNVPVVTVHTLTGHSEAAVWENSAPGTFVTHLAVTDADDGDNGKVGCIGFLPST